MQHPESLSGYLRVARDRADTVVTGLYSRVPHRFVVTRARGPSVHIYATSFGGGLVQDDCVELDVHVEQGASLIVASQGSTKVYKGRLTQQTLLARVGDDGLLSWVPEPITCFAQARYRQSQRFELTESASLFSLDWLTAGRMARGERWCADSYDSRTELLVGNRLIAQDATLLEGSELARRMGRFDVLANLLIVGPRLLPMRELLLREHAQGGVQRQASLLSSVSELRGHGILWRLAGETIEVVRRSIASAIKALAPQVGCDIWARRA